MANKWRVSADSKFLGHYYGKTPEVAVKKAVDAYNHCYSESFAVEDNITAKKCNSSAYAVFSTDDMERICNEQ